MKKIAIIRQRGQLTIPDSLRRRVNWANPMSAVSITIERPDEIIIRPHQQQVNWDKIWQNIKKARAISGKGTQSAVDFLEHDRRQH